jgi:hypothetical protein
VASVSSLLARRASFAAAIAVLLAYLGCIVFAGVAPDEKLDWWALLLAPWNPVTDPWLVFLSAIAMLFAFAARPFQALN